MAEDRNSAADTDKDAENGVQRPGNWYIEIREDIKDLGGQMKAMSAQIAELSEKYDRMPERLSELEKHDIAADAQAADHEKRIAQIESEREKLNMKVWGIIITAAAAAIVAVLKSGMIH